MCTGLLGQACYKYEMSLTRKQVAHRIGRSISTVRKMEGHSLHPRVDWRGVRRFDADEVNEAAKQIAATGRALAKDTDEWANETSPEGLPSNTGEAPERSGLSATEAREWQERVALACSALLDTLPVIDEEVMAAADELNTALEQW